MVGTGTFNLLDPGFLHVGSRRRCDIGQLSFGTGMDHVFTIRKDEDRVVVGFRRVVNPGALFHYLLGRNYSDGLFRSVEINAVATWKTAFVTCGGVPLLVLTDGCDDILLGNVFKLPSSGQRIDIAMCCDQLHTRTPVINLSAAGGPWLPGHGPKKARPGAGKLDAHWLPVVIWRQRPHHAEP